MISSATNAVKRVLRSQLEARGWNISRHQANNGPLIKLLPLLVEHEILVEGKGSVLQVGANDGFLADPVHQIIKSHSLAAILVEPLPDKFEELCRNYSNEPNIRFENVAVSTEIGEAEIFRIDPNLKHLPEWVHGISSFEKSHLLKHNRDIKFKEQKLDAHIQCIRVPVTTVRDLMQRHFDLPKLLLLQVDTEGHDFVVIKSAVEAGCLPRIINYEHKHLSYRDQVSCRDLLSSFGYCFWANGQDTIAYRSL